MRNCTGMISIGWLAIVAAGCATTADWPQFRGPNGNGLTPDESAIVDTWPDGGPSLIWKSEPVPGGDERNGGYSSIAVADGRAFVFVNQKGKVTFDARVLTKGNLTDLGWSDKARLPDDLARAVDEARQSEERMNLADDALGPWIDAWVAEHVPADQTESLGPLVKHRLKLGGAALPCDVLDKLAPMADRLFDTQADMGAWLDENQIPADARALVLAAALSEYVAKDVIMCFDAATGKTIWQVEYPGIDYHWATSSTPTIADGRCYAIGGSGFVYCLDVKDGKEIWKANPCGKFGGDISSSVLVLDGKAIAMCRPLTAFDAKTGRELWRQPKLQGNDNSPMPWRTGGKTYLLCNDEPSASVACVDPADGRILWTVEGGSKSSAVVSGDVMAVITHMPDGHLTAWRLSLTKPEQMWRHGSLGTRAESPVIYNGRVYHFGQEGHAGCVELETGKMVWETGIEHSGATSPIAADGKIITIYGWGKHLMLIDAEADKYTVLATAAMPLASAASPALVDGRLYLRMNNAVACYDVTRSDQP